MEPFYVCLFFLCVFWHFKTSPHLLHLLGDWEMFCELRNFTRLTIIHQAWWWADNEWLFKTGWNYPLIHIWCFCDYLQQQDAASSNDTTSMCVQWRNTVLQLHILLFLDNSGALWMKWAVSDFSYTEKTKWVQVVGFSVSMGFAINTKHIKYHQIQTVDAH